MDTEKIGMYIRELRIKKNLTQEELSTRIFVTNKAISRWETGKSLPEIETLYLLSKELNSTVNEILESGKNTKQEVKEYYVGKQKSKVVLDIIVIGLILILPVLYLFTIQQLSIGVLFDKITDNKNISPELIKDIGNSVNQYLTNFIFQGFIIPWVILLISYFGYKLNNKIILHTITLICLLIIIFTLIFPELIFNSIILEIFIMIISLFELYLIKRNQ